MNLRTTGTFSMWQGLVVLTEAPSVKAMSHAGTFSIWHWLVVLVVLLLIIAPLYFLPGVIAFRRTHRNRVAILVINIFLGFTVIGWIVALIWAFTGDIELEGGGAETTAGRPRPRVPPTL